MRNFWSLFLLYWSALHTSFAHLEVATYKSTVLNVNAITVGVLIYKSKPETKTSKVNYQAVRQVNYEQVNYGQVNYGQVNTDK